MTTPLDLLSLYATAADPVKAPALGNPALDGVARTAAVGQQYNAGAQSAPEMEQDMRTMAPLELFQKYGQATATQMIGARVNADASLARDLAPTRNVSQAAGDIVSAVGIGLGNAVGSLGVVGAGILSPDLGASASALLSEASQWAQGTQSDRLQNRRKVQEERNVLTARDNTQTFEAEREEHGDLVAGFRRVGRDVVDSIATAASDSTNLTSGISQGVGSMIGIGALARKVQGIRAGVTGVANPSAGVTTGTIAAVEASGTYQQTYADVIAIPIESLMETSAEFRKILQTNPLLTPEQARNTLARTTATAAGAMMAPIAAAGGMLTPFAGSPLKVPSVRQGMANILVNEPLEEAIQGGASEVTGNQAMKSFVDEDTQLSEGVGQQVGTGALYGMGTAGTLQGPGAALVATAVTGAEAANQIGKAFSAVRSAAQAADSSISAAAEARRDKVAKESPISDEVLTTAATSVAETVPNLMETVQADLDQQDLTPEQKEQTLAFTGKLVKALEITPEFTEGVGSEAVKKLISGATNKIEALQTLAEIVTRAKEDSPAYDDAGMLFFTTLTEMLGVAQESNDVFVAANGEARQHLDNLQGILNMAGQTPALTKAANKVQKRLDALAEQDNFVAVTEEDLATPEGQLEVQKQVAVAMHAPEKANPETTRILLAHATAGRVKLTPYQTTALQLAIAIAGAARDYDEQVKAAGHISTATSKTGQEVVTSEDEKEGRGSVLTHTKGVMLALQAGKVDEARNNMREFGNFVQHMQNKLGAVNAHLITKEQTAFSAYINGKWKMREGTGVTPRNADSVRFAQVIGMEAELLANVYSDLARSFPDLNAAPISRTTIDSRLLGNPTVVANEFLQLVRQRGEVAPTPVPNTPVKAESTPTPEPKKESVPEPVAKEAAAPAKQEVKPVPQKPVEAIVTPAPVPEPVIVEKTAAEKSGRAVAKLYPNLLESNRFWESYLPLADGFAKLTGENSPLSAAWTAMGNYSAAEQLRSHIENSGKALLKGVKASLNSLLAKEYSKTDKTTYEEKIRQGVVQSMERVRPVNILVDNNGKLEYDQKLLELATLATLQWALVSDQYGTHMEGSDVAAITGGDSNMYGKDLLDALSAGIGRQEAVTSLARKIQEYWGVRSDADAGIGIADGIAYGVAAEFVAFMVRDGDLTEHKYNFDGDGNYVGDGPGTKKTIVRLVPKQRLDKDSPLRSDLYAIDEVAISEIDKPVTIGKPPGKVAARQLRNNRVVNTEDQVQGLENEQATPYKLDMGVLDFYKRVGLDGLLDLLGVTKPDPAEHNVNHFASLEGKYLTAKQGYESLFDELMRVEKYAKENNMDVADVPLHYQFNFNRLGRLQMLGKNNPQSSKIVREAILPTHSTLDLTKAAPYRHYMLAMAQGIGVKVNNMVLKDIVSTAEAVFTGPLKPAVEAIQAWQKSGKAEMPAETRKIIKDAFAAGKDKYSLDLNAAALHNLLDYARYAGMKKADRKAFTTSVYVEADGITNGPVNAMYHLSSGGFTAEQMDNFAKGGLFLGKKKLSFGAFKTARKVAGNEAIDLYQTAADKTKGFLVELYSSLRGTPEVQAHHEKLIRLMALMLPDMAMVKDADGKESLVMKRGIAKNPLTITVYGSGAEGLANKISSLLVDEIYSRMSVAVKANKANPGLTVAAAMFGDTSDPEQSLATLVDGLNSMIGDTVGTAWKNKERIPALESTGITAPNAHPRDYTLNGEQKKALSLNIQELFVKPMVAAIRETVGADTMDNTKLLRQATQMQSIVLVRAFRVELDKLLAQKAKNPKWIKSDFISRNELDALYSRVKHLSPLLDLGNQEFFIGGAETAQLHGSTIARSFDESLRVDATVTAPKQAGVSGIPITVIGSGDAAMMLYLAATNGLQGNLKVFDGVNLSLSNLDEDARKVNEAVGESWKLNPLMSLYESLKSIPEDAVFDVLTKDDIKAMMNALGVYNEEEIAAVTGKQTGVYFAGILSQLGEAAKSAEARRKALAGVSSAIDQMAAANVSHQTEGKDLSDKSEEEVLNILNEAHQKELALLDKERSAVSDVTALGEMGRKHKSGARIVTAKALSKSAQKLKIPQAQRDVFNEMLNSLSGADVKVVYGTAEQVFAVATEAGVVLDNMANGQYDVTGRTIYLINPSAEVLVHELIHAATFAAVHAYYSGEDLGENRAIITGAVKRIELLRTQFLSLGDQISNLSDGAKIAYHNAVAAITEAMEASDYSSDPVLKAKSLNEFMAWGLSNQAVMRLQKRNEANPLVRIGKAILEGVRALIWGKAKAPTAGKDMLSNLMFNASILAKVQPSVAEVVHAGMLYHSNTYGNNQRLQRLEAMLRDKITGFLGTAVQPGVVSPTTKLRDAQDIAAKAELLARAKGFQMTAQETTVFGMVVSALATEIELDSPSLGKAQELFAHVTKNLKVEHFMADPDNPLDLNDRYDAQDKFDVVTGNYGNARDKADRSTLLPIFLGLALTSDDMRKALAQIELPKKNKTDWASIDGAIEGVGNTLIDALSHRLTGTKGKEKSVQDAIHSLSDRMLAVAEKRDSMIEQAAETGGGFIDGMNQRMVDGLGALSDAALTAADKLETRGDMVSRSLASSARILAGVINEENGQAVAEGIMGMANRTKMWQPFHDLINDLMGRTQSNAEVYDMIKGLRSMSQQDRQQYREELSAVFASKFSRPVTDAEWSAMSVGMGKTDLSVLLGSRSMPDVLALLKDDVKLNAEIVKLERNVRNADAILFKAYKNKMEQLAKFMITGEAPTGLLRNAYAIIALSGKATGGTKQAVDAALMKDMDDLISLYAVQAMTLDDKHALSSLVQDEPDGVSFLMHYLTGQRVEEQRKVATSEVSKLNHYKGHMPTESEEGVSLRVAPDSEYADLVERGYVRVGTYQGSTADSLNTLQGYYYAPVNSRAAFNQGVLQTVRATASGVDPATGYTMSMTAGRITKAGYVKRAVTRMSDESGNERLLPVYDEAGDVIAFERSVDPAQVKRIRSNTHLGQVIGIWRGRQVEEAKADIINKALVKALHDMYKNDMRSSSSNAGQYVDLFAKTKDPVIADAVALIPEALRAHIKETFGDSFLVRKDMLNDAVGYRDASVGDIWTGNSRISPQVQKVVRDSIVAAFGMKAYEYALKGEGLIQNAVSEARLLIAVKSVVVPIGNMVSNLLQLLSRGVSPAFIAKTLPKKLAELENYQRSRLRLMNAEAELLAAVNDVVATRRLKAEIQAINDSHRRLSIWPLLQAGEFSSISDASVAREDVMLSSGRLSDYVHTQIEKLPKNLQTPARYAIISKETALFKGLQKSVAYGDFLAKAVLYDSLIQQKKMSGKDALGRITEEFVNYDRLPGRSRGYVEGIGLLWFYNFKIRISKIALSTLRNNPLHALLAFGAVPAITGPIGTPLDDNLVSKLLDGSLTSSIGPGMGFNSVDLNPVSNLLF